MTLFYVIEQCNRISSKLVIITVAKEQCTVILHVRTNDK